MDEVDILLRAYPFQDLVRADLEPLLPAFRKHSYEAEEHVWQAGDSADHLWFVIKGHVRGIVTNADGMEAVMQVMGPGESFGQPALFLPDTPRLTTTVASVRSELMSLEREALLHFLETHPRALRRMLESMSRLVFHAGGMVQAAAFHDVRGRVAYQLLKFADEYGEAAPDGVRIALKLSQSTLAGLTAASRESVNRALSGFVATGDMRREGGYIVITRPEGLRRALRG